MSGFCCILSAGKKFCPMRGGGGGKRRAVERDLNDIRQFRDEVLEEHPSGRLLEWMYYHVFSPPAVVLLKVSERFQDVLNRKIRPYLAEKCRIWTSQYKGGSING